MRYGYARVSTKGQARDGNSLEAQEKVLRDNGAEVIYHDAFTGTKVDRPELSKLVGLLQEGDILIVTKLDRLGRSLSKTTELITELIERGVTINILNLGILSNNSVNTLMRNVLLAFAQFERDMILERTSEGKEIARQQEDYREGRPSKRTEEFETYREKVESGEMTVKAACGALGISTSSWKRYCKAV